MTSGCQRKSPATVALTGLESRVNAQVHGHLEAARISYHLRRHPPRVVESPPKRPLPLPPARTGIAGRALQRYAAIRLQTTGRSFPPCYPRARGLGPPGQPLAGLSLPPSPPLNSESATESRDERALLHSITSSALTRREGGTVMPRAFAVCRLMTNSNLVDCKTGIWLVWPL